jgi:hypothetical protein
MNVLEISTTSRKSVTLSTSATTTTSCPRFGSCRLDSTDSTPAACILPTTYTSYKGYGAVDMRRVEKPNTCVWPSRREADCQNIGRSRSSDLKSFTSLPFDTSFRQGPQRLQRIRGPIINRPNMYLCLNEKRWHRTKSIIFAIITMFIFTC